METSTVVQTVATVIASVAALTASVTALVGIDAWRREHIGKKRVDLAEETLALFYEASDAISAIRNPLGWPGDGESRKAGKDETPEETSILNRWYVFYERYEKRQQIFNRIHALRYRFMAQVGKDEAEPFLELNRVLNQILLDAKSISKIALRFHKGEIRGQKRVESYQNQMDEKEKTVWEGADVDPIAPRMKKLIAGIERTCQTMIRNSRGSLFDVEYDGP
ncbi:MAG: hypothetical protein IH991_15775 [Planctomycetes bacterium]|nr:hypothetical protein [Planctomycetota bacterium]